MFSAIYANSKAFDVERVVFGCDLQTHGKGCKQLHGWITWQNVDYGECPTEASPDRRETPERLSHSYEQDVCSYVSSFLANFARIDRASALTC